MASFGLVSGDASDDLEEQEADHDGTGQRLMAGLFDDAFKDVAKKIPKATKKTPTKSRSASKRAPANPSRGLGGNATASVLGVVSGTARAAKQGKSPAATQRAVKRDTAKLRRTDAIRSYLDAPRAERSKQAAAAERRVARGNASSRDKLIVETHQRRTKNDTGRSRTDVRAANRAHDREVAAEKARDAVSAAIDRLGKQRLTVSTKDDSKSLLDKLVDDVKSAPSDLLSGTKKNVKSGVDATADVAIASGNALTAASELRLPGATRSELKGTRAGLDPSGAAKVAALPVKVTANVAKVAADDPSTLKRIPGDLKAMVENIPASVIQAAKDPAGAGSDVIADYKRRYGPLVAGRDAEFRERLKKEGYTAEIVDVLGTVQTGGTASATSGAARAVAKTTKTGSVVNRAANRIDRFVRDERPDRLVAPNRAVAQRKSKTLPGIVVQRTLDDQRKRRVVRQLDQAKQAKTPLDEATTPAQAKAQRKAQAKRQRSGGKGVRGIVPGDNQVVPLRAKARERDLRKATSRVTSAGFRRMERLSNELSRDAERRFNALKVPEQRAAVYALEGTINPADASASIKAVDRRARQIRAERTRMQTDDADRWNAEYAPLINDPDLDELVRLRELKQQLQVAPNKVLTPKLREFIAGEQQRRGRVEEVAGDSLRPSTLLARRFLPAGELLGTREAYAPRRAALERLETTTPDVALRQIGVEIKRARAARNPETGKVSQKARALAAEARAVQQIAQGHPSNKRVPADVLDRARTVEAEKFAESTRTVAQRQGLGDIDPTYVLHRKRDTGGAGAFAAGASAAGAVAGAKKSDGSLFRKGMRDTSGRAYALGIQESIKRSVQWRQTNELMQDLVPEWAKNNGKGFTLKDWQEASKRQVLDPQDWVIYKPKRERRSMDDPDPTLDDDGLPDGEMIALKDMPNVDWETHDRFYVIPIAALNEMKRGNGPLATLARQYGRFTTTQSGLLLGSNPAYGIKQAAQSVPMVLVQVGTKWVDPVFYRNLLTYRRAAKLSPAQWRDLQDDLSVRSKSADAIRSTRRGTETFDVRKYDGALQHTWGGLFGAAAKDWWVSPRKEPGPKGTASQAARTALRSNPAIVPFRLIRDGNVAFDAWQDRLARTLSLAAADARLKNSGRWAQETAAATGDTARKLGPIAALYSLPADQFAKHATQPWVRHAGYDAADDVTRLLGDYGNFTQREQLIGRTTLPFFGFMRHSTRLLFNVLPLEHPLSLSIVLAGSNIDLETKEQIFEEWMKRKHNLDMDEIPKDLLAGFRVVVHQGDELELVDDRWLNPLTGPLFDALTNGPGEAAGSTFTPVFKGAAESVFQTNLFTKARLSNAQGQVDAQTNPLTLTDQTRVVANRFLSALFPFRVYNDLVNGKKGKLTDTSLPFDAVKFPYKPTPSGKLSDAGERNEQRKADQARQSGMEKLLDAAIPGRAKPATSAVDRAEYFDEKTGPKKPKPKRTNSGGGFGGGSGFGSGGGFGGSTGGGW